MLTQQSMNAFMSTLGKWIVNDQEKDYSVVKRKPEEIKGAYKYTPEEFNKILNALPGGNTLTVTKVDQASARVSDIMADNLGWTLWEVKDAQHLEIGRAARLAGFGGTYAVALQGIANIEKKIDLTAAAAQFVNSLSGTYEITLIPRTSHDLEQIANLVIANLVCRKDMFEAISKYNAHIEMIRRKCKILDE